jgi:hypothetical protein
MTAVALMGGVAHAEAETCLPRVGETLRLKQALRAQAGIVVRVFEPYRNDAEFRGCEAGVCGLMVHRRQRDGARWVPVPAEARGFGEDLSVPQEDLHRLVVLPACAAPVEPEPPVPKRRRRVRRAKPRRAPVPVEPAPVEPTPVEPAPVHDNARVVVAPSPQALFRQVGGDLEGPTVDGAGIKAEVGPFGVIAPGTEVPLNRRVMAVIGDDGRLSFAANAKPSAIGGMPIDPEHDGLVGDTLDGFMPMQGGIGGSGEGLNALDGVDIDGPLKEAFAKATFEQRFGLYRKARKRAVATSLGVLVGRLRALEMSTQSPVEQRVGLFLLWDEYADSTDPAAHTAFEDAGAQARALIEDWARQPGRFGGQGFAEDELDALNRAAGRVGARRVFKP